jgi:hypothetical protein
MPHITIIENFFKYKNNTFFEFPIEIRHYEKISSEIKHFWEIFMEIEQSRKISDGNEAFLEFP